MRGMSAAWGSLTGVPLKRGASAAKSIAGSTFRFICALTVRSSHWRSRSIAVKRSRLLQRPRRRSAALPCSNFSKRLRGKGSNDVCWRPVWVDAFWTQVACPDRPVWISSWWISRSELGNVVNVFKRDSQTMDPPAPQPPASPRMSVVQHLRAQLGMLMASFKALLERFHAGTASSLKGSIGMVKQAGKGLALRGHEEPVSFPCVQFSSEYGWAPLSSCNHWMRRPDANPAVARKTRTRTRTRPRTELYRSAIRLSAGQKTVGTMT